MNYGVVGGGIFQAEGLLNSRVQGLTLIGIIVEKIGVFLGSGIEGTGGHGRTPANIFTSVYAKARPAMLAKCSGRNEAVHSRMDAAG